METTLTISSDYFLTGLNKTYMTYCRDFINTQRTFNPENVRAYLDGLKMTRSASTVRTAKYALKTALCKQAKTIHDRAIIETVFKELKTPKSEKIIHAEKIIAGDGVRRAIDSCRTAKQKTLIKAFSCTALRVSELLNIKISDCVIMGERVFIRVIGKGQKERRVIMPGALFSEIMAAYNGKVFLFENKSGTPLSRQYAHRIAKQTGRRTGQKIHPHTFRHTWATRAIKAGLPLQAVSNYLGHANTATTADFYCHTEIGGDEIENLFREMI